MRECGSSRRLCRSRRTLPPEHASGTGERRHVLRAGLALGAAGAVTAAAVIAAVAHGPATKATPIAAPALRTRLLAAIDTASGDILYTHGDRAPAERGLAVPGVSPAWPGSPCPCRPGRGLGREDIQGRGVLLHDALRERAADSSYTANLDQGGLQLSGTVLAVNHFRHVWGEWHSNFILGFTLDAAGIRAEIANGQFTVIGRTELHGQQAIELKINVPPSNEAPPHVTAERMWVNATTYLPMREYTALVQWAAERLRLRLPPAHAREPGETAPGNPGGLHPRQRQLERHLFGPETEDDEEVATSATAKRPVAGPLRRHRPPGAKQAGSPEEPKAARGSFGKPIKVLPASRMIRSALPVTGSDGSWSAPSSSTGAGTWRADGGSRFGEADRAATPAGRSRRGGRERDNRSPRKTAACGTAYLTSWPC